LGVAPRLFAFPPRLLELAARAAGRGQEARRLLGSLEVDSALIRRELGWAPRHALEEGLAETARWFRAAGAGSGSFDRAETTWLE
ncbi:MAG TPA: hypothetical protein VNK67_14640, partial [Burkholderiales bacterium]|nr:hypothetical protein [Burkholderiales bacterium]